MSSAATTERLQRLIDAGGHVVVPPGEHVVRTLHLRSGVTFDIPADATLLPHRDNRKLGGGDAMLDPVPEQVYAYPQCTMFGRLPAWGLYARHVRELALRDVEFAARMPDARDVVVLDDVTRVD